MNKFNSNAFGLASGVILSFCDIFALALIIIFPRFSLFFFSQIFSIKITKITANLTWGNVILSIVISFLLGYILGAIFSALYNAFNKFDETHNSQQAGINEKTLQD
jgi:hypothetical protein